MSMNTSTAKAVSKTLAQHPRWKLEPGVKRQDGFINTGMSGNEASWVKPGTTRPVFDRHGEFVRSVAEMEYSEPEYGYLDLEHFATKGLVLQRIREVTGDAEACARLDVNGRTWRVYAGGAQMHRGQVMNHLAWPEGEGEGRILALSLLMLYAHMDTIDRRLDGITTP